MFNELAAEYVEIHAYDRGVLVDISETTKDLLGSVLEDTVEQGLTYDQTRENISEFYEDLEDWETLRIARTEIAMACRYGNLLTIQQMSEDLGIKIKRVFLSPAEDACEEVCLPMAKYTRENVVSIKEALKLSEELHPNCRCDWIYEVDDVELSLPVPDGRLKPCPSC